MHLTEQLMKKSYIVIFLFLMLDKSFSQKKEMQYINNTGRTLRLYDTRFSFDTTKLNGYLLLTKSPTISGLGTNLYSYDSKDTIFVKSYSSVEINATPFIININNGDINKLPPMLTPLPRLKIKAKSFSQILKINDPIDLKISDKTVVQGFIKSFDSETISIKDKDDKEIKIQRKEIIAIKDCSPILAVGSKSFFHKCNYTNLENVNFKAVHQVKVDKPNDQLWWIWQE
jgi:hypothetical protein